MVQNDVLPSRLKRGYSSTMGKEERKSSLSKGYLQPTLSSRTRGVPADVSPHKSQESFNRL